MHGIESLALGSPRFDSSRVPNAPSCADAKLFLGLGSELNYILFAGASFPFDEVGALNLLSAHLKNEGLWQHRIIYRPHPMAWRREHGSELSEDSKQFVCGDPTRSLFDKNDFRQYQYLLKSVSGLITPYSTMLIEAAMYGVPSLAIGYNSRCHPEYDWMVNSIHQPHLRFVKGARWIVECHREEELSDAFADFLDLLGEPSVCDDARTDFGDLVCVTDESYGDRLTRAILRAVSELVPDR